MGILAIKIVIGILTGIVLCYVSNYLEKIILHKRNLEIKTSGKEKVVFMLLAAVAGALTMVRFSNSGEIIYTFIIIIICILIARIDLHHRIIPNELLLIMLVTKLIIGVLALLGMDFVPKVDIINSLIGFVAGFIIFMVPAFIGKSVGAGDIKLAAVTGFCLGVNGLLYSIVLMGICVLTYELFKKKTRLRSAMYEMIPLGPFMALSTVIVMLLDYNMLIEFFLG